MFTKLVAAAASAAAVVVSMPCN